MAAYGQFVVVAENIRSQHNVGAIFRSADGAGVSFLFLVGYTSFPPRPQIAKVALGAEERVPWQHAWHVGPVLEELARDGYQLAALETELGAVRLGDFPPRWPLALLLGNEVSGLSPEALWQAHQRVFIPMRGAKRSLNVSVAFGVAAFRLAESLP